MKTEIQMTLTKKGQIHMFCDCHREAEKNLNATRDTTAGIPSVTAQTQGHTHRQSNSQSMNTAVMDIATCLNFQVGSAFPINFHPIEGRRGAERSGDARTISITFYGSIARLARFDVLSTTPSAKKKWRMTRWLHETASECSRCD